jgi:hypothetical protein
VREYFVRVIHISDGDVGDSSGDWLVVDAVGDPAPWPTGEGPLARLIVDDVTDAVKDIDEDRVVASRDREELWALRGFVVHREVLKVVGRGEYTPHDLIDAVTGAGFTWSAVRIASS